MGRMRTLTDVDRYRGKSHEGAVLGNWVAHIPSNSAEMLTPRASANTFMALIEGLAPPVSIRDMYVLAKPHLSANSS